MTPKRSIKKLAISLALAGAAMSAQAQYSGVYSFGDSYSDIGAYNWFSNSATNQGIWAARVAAAFGYTLSTAYPGFTGNLTAAPNATGTSFAIGGGQTHNVTGVKGTNTQISDLLARSGGHLDSGALYLLFIGGNDVNAALNTAVGGGFSAAAVANAQGQMVAAATAVATQVAQLRAAGAKNIVVLNLPNFAPLPITQGAAAQVGAIAGATGKEAFLSLAQALPAIFDKTLEAGLKDQGAMTFDVAQFVYNLFTNPTAFGISNTAVPVCGGSGVNWNNCHGVPSNGALFADALHMTDAGHALLADWVIGAMRATGDAAGLANMAAMVPLGRSGAQWRALETRTRDFQNAPRKGDRLFAGGDYADGTSDTADGTEAADGNTTSFTLGYETTFGDRTLVGGAVGRERGNFDLAGNSGNITYNESVLSLFVSHRITDSWYVNGTVSHGIIGYGTKRNVAIGPLKTTETADFGGKHESLRTQLGYQMKSGSLVHGPFIGADWESLRVDGFSEGNSASAITVGKQSVKSSHARIGYEMATDASLAGTSLRPWAQLSYDEALDDSARSYAVGMGSTGSRVTITQRSESGGFTRLAFGASMRVGTSTEVSVGLSGTFDNPAGDDKAITVMFSAPL